MFISASNGWVALVMSSSSGFLGVKAGRNAKRPHFLGCGLLENVAELVNQRCRRTRRNPSSSLERRRKDARRLVRFGFMVQAHTAERCGMSSGQRGMSVLNNQTLAVTVLRSLARSLAG